MQLLEIAFGPHARIEQLFERAGRPVRLDHPAAMAMGP
jgi:hypothetical protein